MPGNKEGGIKSRETHYIKYGKDWYSKIGKIGGSVNRPETRPFANRKLASEAGYKGGIVTGAQYKTRRKV